MPSTTDCYLKREPSGARVGPSSGHYTRTEKAPVLDRMGVRAGCCRGGRAPDAAGAGGLVEMGKGAYRATIAA